MIDQFVNFVIRPPRAEYNPDQYLWEKDFSLAGRKYKREDVELRNERGHTLRCSHYVPAHFPDDAPLPCVIYCHGNSGCRADANEVAVVLLPSDITVFTLDFSGSGLSEGDYVSLGWHEKNDLKVVVSFLRRNQRISRIGLWGRSMGAVTCLLYGAEDPSIAGMVLDSAFSNLFDLMMELADLYKIRLPKFTVKMAVRYMRRVIRKKAKFDIMRLDCIKAAAPNTFIPALFGHAKDDTFVQPRHSDSIFQSYAGDKNIIKFDGDHNSSRPQFYYDSVAIFFFNVLRPPQPQPSSLSAKIEKYYNLVEEMNSGKGVEENILYKIIAELRNAGGGVPSSSSTAATVSAKKTVEQLLSDIAPACNYDTLAIDDAELHIDDALILEKKSDQKEEKRCSHTSSNRESWGRCSSLGSVSDDNGVDCTSSSCNNRDQTEAETSLREPQQSKLLSPRKDDTEKKKRDKTKKKKNNKPKKSKREKFEKLEAMSQRLRLCILKRVNHMRHCSS